MVDMDAVQPKIIDKHIAIIRRDGGAMRMRDRVSSTTGIRQHAPIA